MESSCQSICRVSNFDELKFKVTGAIDFTANNKELIILKFQKLVNIQILQIRNLKII